MADQLALPITSDKSLDTFFYIFNDLNEVWFILSILKYMPKMI